MAAPGGARSKCAHLSDTEGAEGRPRSASTWTQTSRQGPPGVKTSGERLHEAGGGTPRTLDGGMAGQDRDTRADRPGLPDHPPAPRARARVDESVDSYST